MSIGGQLKKEEKTGQLQALWHIFELCIGSPKKITHRQAGNLGPQFQFGRLSQLSITLEIVILLYQSSLGWCDELLGSSVLSLLLFIPLVMV